MIKKFSKELIAYISSALIVWFCILLIKQEGCIHAQIVSAIDRCLNVIIPSLFAFMAFSGIIINTGLHSYISKPFYPISKYIFAMPNELFFVFVLSNVSGYPIGAKLLVQLTEENKISKRTASIMSCFCYGGGPAFYSGVVGMTVFGSTQIGIMIFLSVIAANLVIALILNRIYKPQYIKEKQSIKFNSETIVDSVISAGKSMFTVCATIIFFSVIISLLEVNGFFETFKALGLSENQCTLIKSLFEISNLSELTDSNINLLPFICGICSFGGICVLIQIKAIVGKSYSLNYFLVSRVMSMPLSGAICSLILKYYHPKVVSAAAVKAQIVARPDNMIPSACLIAMIMILFMHKKAARN